MPIQSLLPCSVVMMPRSSHRAIIVPIEARQYGLSDLNPSKVGAHTSSAKRAGGGKNAAHLIRDMNQDLLNNPFDEDLQSITKPFSSLLRSIVAIIDEHGLQRRYLERHAGQVEEFFRVLS